MGQTESIRMKLNPCTPPGRSNRKARAFAAEIARLRLVGYGCQAIREALAEAGLNVSKSTVQRELARLSRPAPIAAWQMPVLPAHPDPELASPVAPTPTPTRQSLASEPRSGKDIAEAFVKGRITNPLLRSRS